MLKPKLPRNHLGRWVTDYTGCFSSDNPPLLTYQLNRVYPVSRVGVSQKFLSLEKESSLMLEPKTHT